MLEEGPLGGGSPRPTPGPRPPPMPRRRPRTPLGPLRGLTLLLGLALALGPAADASAAAATGAAGASGTPPPPPLATNFGGALLSFSSLALGPGSSGTLTVTVTDPTNATVAGWGRAISSGSLELEIYRFSYDGSEQNLTPGDSWAPGWTSGGRFVNETLPSLAVGASTSFGLQVEVPTTASTGAYFVRDRVDLFSGGTEYVLGSRGTFPDALWNAATLTNCTASAGCTPTLNLTMLGVSGVSPETSISVTNTWVPWVLYSVLGASIGLAAIAGYLVFRPGRRRPSGASSAGATRSPRRRRAASALGKRRKSDGD